MKTFLSVLILIVGVKAIADVSDKQNQIVDLAAGIINAAKSQNDENVLNSAIASLEPVLADLDENSTGASSCLNDLLDKGYSLTTAKDTCVNMKTSSQHKCLINMLDKGYSLTTAKDTCVNMKTNSQYKCLIDILDKGYSLTTAQNTCVDMKTTSQYQCLVDMLNKGYSLTTAKSTCINF